MAVFSYRSKFSILGNYGVNKFPKDISSYLRSTDRKISFLVVVLKVVSKLIWHIPCEVSQDTVVAYFKVLS